MFDDLMQTLNDPNARHAMLVHFPIAGVLLGLLLSLVWLMMRMRSAGLCAAAAIVFLTTGLGAALASSAGEAAVDHVERRSLTPAEKLAIEKHEELAENGWIWPVIPGVLLGLAAFSRSPEPGRITRIRVAAGLLAIAAGGGASVWIANVAHAGGVLVYRHSLGVPAREALSVPTPAGRAADPASRDDRD